MPHMLQCISRPWESLVRAHSDHRIRTRTYHGGDTLFDLLLTNGGRFVPLGLSASVADADAVKPPTPSGHGYDCTVALARDMCQSLPSGMWEFGACADDQHFIK